MDIEDKLNQIHANLNESKKRYDEVKRIAEVLAPKSNKKPEPKPEPVIDEVKKHNTLAYDDFIAHISNTAYLNKITSLNQELNRFKEEYNIFESSSEPEYEEEEAQEIDYEQLQEDIKVEAYAFILVDGKNPIKLISGDSYNIRVLLQEALGNKTENLKRTLKFKSTPSIIEDFGLNRLFDNEREYDEKKLNQVKRYSIPPYQVLSRKEIILLTYAIAYFESRTEVNPKFPQLKAAKILFFMKKMASHAQEIELIERSFEVLYKNGSSIETLENFGKEIKKFFDDQEDDLYIEYMDNVIMPKQSSPLKRKG